MTNRLGMALFSNESFLHYPSVSFQQGCVLYNRKGRSVFPSLCTSGTITVNNGVLSHTENVLLFHACSPLCHQFAQSELHNHYLCLTYAARGTSFHS